MFSPLELLTPVGWYQLELAHPLGISRYPIASQEELKRVWFFFEFEFKDLQRLEHPRVLELYFELTHQTVFVHNDWNYPTPECIFEALAAGLRLGRLQLKILEKLDAWQPVEWEPPPVADKPRRNAPALTPSELWGRAGDKDEQEVHFAVRLVDELGDPIADQEVIFEHRGRTETVTTSGDGLAEYDAIGPTTATVEVASTEAIREAIAPRWELPRQVAFKDWVKADDAANLAVQALRSTGRLQPCALTAEKRKTLSIQPWVAQARITGTYFDTNKCFLLPTVLPYIKRIKQLYDKYPLSTLLIVGHTDATGEPASNDPLSLERADAMAAFLKDEVDAWLAWYDSSSANKRWGAAEDRLMIRSMPDYSSKPPEEERVHWYQRTRGLEADSIAGPLTRRKLISEYMAHDGTTLPPGVSIVTHGCGENFPLPEPAPVDQSSSDRHSEIEDRRIELFFFDQSLGIQPAPPGPISSAGTQAYPEWQARTLEFTNMNASGVAKEVTLLEMHDALFRSNSAVLLPEGEDPTSTEDDHLSLTTVGIVATLLRYNEEHPGKKMLIAGHCDTTNTAEFNQPLSEERASVALALLEGDREAFIELCDKRHDEIDVTQIFDWTTSAYGFNCKPTRLDAKPSRTRYNQFRMSYNAWVQAWDPAAEPDPRGPGTISQWGVLDKSVWGAIFDLYEHGLREELGEDGAGVAELRGKITWVDDSRKALGFSEHHPVDNLGRDGYRSQANRRVENLFFDDGEEPDMALAEAAPEQSELYLPGIYERRHLGARKSGMPTDLVRIHLFDVTATPMPGARWELDWGSTEPPAVGVADAEGWLETNVSACYPTCTLRWGAASALVFEHQREISVGCGGQGGSDDVRFRMLNNLGYPDTAGKDVAVRLFQVDHGLPETGLVNGAIPVETAVEIEFRYDAACATTSAGTP